MYTAATYQTTAVIYLSNRNRNTYIQYLLLIGKDKLKYYLHQFRQGTASKANSKPYNEVSKGHFLNHIYGLYSNPDPWQLPQNFQGSYNSKQTKKIHCYAVCPLSNLLPPRWSAIRFNVMVRVQKF